MLVVATVSAKPHYHMESRSVADSAVVHAGGFALIYYLAPDLHEGSWAWVTPGSVVGVGLWLLGL